MRKAKRSNKRDKDKRFTMPGVSAAVEEALIGCMRICLSRQARNFPVSCRHDHLRRFAEEAFQILWTAECKQMTSQGKSVRLAYIKIAAENKEGGNGYKKILHY